MHTTSAFQLRETALGAAEQLLCTPELTLREYIRSFRQRSPRSLRDHATFFKSQHIPVVRSDRPRPICMLGSNRTSAGGICTTGRLNIEESIISQNRIWKMAQECSNRLHWMSLDDCPCWTLDHKYLRRSHVDKNKIILSSSSQICLLPKKHHK
jgi:hypothetical protein